MSPGLLAFTGKVVRWIQAEEEIIRAAPGA
jgi:hypothetical protein